MRKIPFEELQGVKYGKLTVVQDLGCIANGSGKPRRVLRCKCDCGNFTDVQLNNLRNGHTKSCGKCVSIEDLGDCMYYHCSDGDGFLFDREDLPIAQSAVWHNDQLGYARARDDKRLLRFHRCVMDCPDGYVVDHINSDPRDNRKKNLRITTQHNNTCSSRARRNSTTGYKGVCFDKYKSRYMAHIHPNGRMVFIGYYSTPEEAALAYNEAALQYFGDYAKLNVIGKPFETVTALDRTAE